MKYTPRPYQKIITRHILENPRCGVWAGMGLGKTASTLTAIDGLILAGEVSKATPALILAPLRVARDTWPDEVAKWDHLNYITIQAMVGEEAERRAAMAPGALVYTLNYENLPWLVEQLQRQKRPWPFRTVVSDESTKLKGFRLQQGTKRARALAQVAHVKVDRFIELTGTPAPNGLQDLWGQGWFLDGGLRLGRTHDAFKQRWFQRSHSGYGIEPLDFAQVQIEDKMRDICISLNAADYFDIKKPIINIITIDLDKKSMALYRDMERQMYAEIEGEGVEAFNAASRTNKCSQLANGAAYLGDADDEGPRKYAEIHKLKIDALEDIIEEAAGMPVLVAYSYKSDLARLKKHFPAGRDLSEAANLKAFKEGKVPVGFAHPASLGHGVDGLQNVTNILAFFGVDWDLELHDQIIERVGPVRQLQAGFNRPVFLHYIMARNTVDFLKYERLTSKRSVQSILLEALKHRKKEKYDDIV